MTFARGAPRACAGAGASAAASRCETSPGQAHRLQVGVRRARRSRCPPDLTTPRYDDRYAVNTASGTRRSRTRRGRKQCRAAARPIPTRASRVPATSAGWSSRRRPSRRGRRRAPVLGRQGLRHRQRAAGAGRDGNRLGGEPRRDSAGPVPQVHRQVPRRVLLDVQARQVPHAHRARHRARHGRNLHLASRHGAGADGEDRQRAAARRSHGPRCRPIPSSKPRCWRG